MNIAGNSLIGASQFVGMFARGEISSKAFVRDLLSRSTEQANLNTFTWVNSDGALKAARA